MADFGGAPLSLTNRLNRRKSAMWNERLSYDQHVREVFEQTAPRRTRFTQTQTNKGDRRNSQIIDNTGVISTRVLVSGMVNGMSSPATPWFKYEPQDLALLEYGPAKEWIDKLERLVRRIFEASNVYEALPVLYRELCLAGTAAGVIEDDFEDVIRVSTFTWGEYALALNDRRVVDTLYRELRMTVLQCVQKFGYKNCSQTVRSLYDNSGYDNWVDVMHAIEPNNERKADKLDSGNMAFRSVYWEPANGSNSEGEKFLRKSGYRQNPIIAPRWDVVGNDVYGSSCPGMEALGDMRQIQILHKRLGRAIDNNVNPATQGPSSLADRFVSTLPGHHNVVANSANGKIESVFNNNVDTSGLIGYIDHTKARIEEAFFVPYILSISQIEGVQPRNQWEISERKGEGLMVLGPVVQRLQNELHGPLHERTLNRIYEVCIPLWEAGEAAMIEPPPPELQGMPLRINYISPLSQIQRQAGVANVERLVAMVTNPNVAAVMPDAIKKIDGAQMVDEVADWLGIGGKIIRSDQTMEAMAEAEAAQQQAMQLAQMAAPMKDVTGALKDLSETNVGGGRGALETMLEQGQEQAAEEDLL